MAGSPKGTTRSQYDSATQQHPASRPAAPSTRRLSAAEKETHMEFQTAVNTIKSLHEAAQSISEAHAQHEREKASGQATLRKLGEEIEAKSRELQALGAQIAASRETAAKAKSEADALQAKVDALHKARVDEETKLRVAREQYEALKNSLR